MPPHDPANLGRMAQHFERLDPPRRRCPPCNHNCRQGRDCPNPRPTPAAAIILALACIALAVLLGATR